MRLILVFWYWQNGRAVYITEYPLCHREIPVFSSGGFRHKDCHTLRRSQALPYVPHKLYNGSSRRNIHALGQRSDRRPTVSDHCDTIEIGIATDTHCSWSVNEDGMSSKKNKKQNSSQLTKAPDAVHNTAG
jgi:hypothetical protein